MPIIGAHVSAAGGVSEAIKNAKKIGAECMQIFGSSPQQWVAKLPPPEEVKKYKEDLKKSGLGPVFLHSAYLVNLASPEPITAMRSVKSLVDHLKIAEELGAEGLIFHIGSGKGTDKKEAIEEIVLGMKKVLEETKRMKAKLIMENDAGGGGKVGNQLEDIAYIFRKVDSPRVKICLDTAHSFESGLIPEFTAPAIIDFFDKFEKEIGCKNLAVLHINDSKTEAGSHHDRHENIGEGKIGLKGFANLAKEPDVKNLPWSLEVPGFEGMGSDKKNIGILKGIIKKS